MYLRRKCYSSLYDDLYNDYLYERCYSDAYDYYTRLFSDDDDYGKQGALIGAGIGAAGGLTAAGIAGKKYYDLYKASLDSLKGKTLTEKQKKVLEDAEEYLSKNESVQKRVDKAYENNAKKLSKALEKAAKDDAKEDAIKSLVESYEKKGERNAVLAMKRNRILAGLGIGTAGIAGLAGAGYGIGKSKKRD